MVFLTCLLVTLLVCAATTTLDPEPLPERVYGAPQMSMDQALNLYKYHYAQQRAGGQPRRGRPRREPDIEEVRAEILRKVAAMERAETAIFQSSLESS